jgi:putative transcriptional regulator
MAPERVKVDHAVTAAPRTSCRLLNWPPCAGMYEQVKVAAMSVVGRIGMIGAALLISAALLAPRPLIAVPTPGESPIAPGSTSLTGQLLIATPSMADPRFVHTVILMVRHDRNGAVGLVINRPLGERSLKELLQALGDKDAADAEGNVPVFSGGPVQPELGFVIHSADYHRAGTLVIDSRVAMTSSREILRDIAAKQGPAHSLVAFGYAGWAPGQLDGEMALRAWFTAADDTRLVFEEDRDKVYDEAMKRRTQDL